MKLLRYCLFVCASLQMSLAQGFEIMWHNRSASGFDATEQGVVDAAIQIWENIFSSNGSSTDVFHLFMREDSIDGSGDALGNASASGTYPNGSPSGATIVIDSADDPIFFDDPTPLLNEEYQQHFLNDYTFVDYGGESPSAAFGKRDLLTVVLHELGHGLGVSPAYSRWNALDALSLGLTLTPDKAHTDHLAHQLDFMNPSGEDSLRALPSDIVIAGLLEAFDYQLLVPGDFDNDGLITAGDYTAWRDKLGAPQGTLPNDTHGGEIGVGQYELWTGTYGTTASGATLLFKPQSIPEPPCVVLIVVVFTAMLRKRWSS